MSLEQELTKLNIDIGTAEKQRDKDTLDHVLANELVFRRASGVVIDKATYLKELQNLENTYNYLCTEVIDIKLSESQDTTVVTLHVRAKGKRYGNPFEGVYRNIRFFRKERQDWKCYAWFNELLEPLPKKDAYTLYEAGKKRRYELLFAVNGGAFAIAKLLTDPGNTEQVLGNLTLVHLAIGMIVFTALMCFDIFKSGENMRDRHLKGEVFGRPGQIVLVSLGILICLGWLFAVFDLSVGFSEQSTALLFPIGFLGIFRLFLDRFPFR